MNESTDKRPLDEAPAEEQELDAYLKGDSSVSRQYRQLHSAEIPADLDRLVLRQAEEAVKSRNAGAGRPAWMRWTAPLAVAASAVLVVSIVIESGVSDKVVLQAPATVSAPVSPGFVPPAEIATQAATEEAFGDSSERRELAPAAPPPPPKLVMPAPQVPRMAEPAVELPNAFPQSAATADVRDTGAGNEAVEKPRDASAEVARNRAAAPPVSMPAPASPPAPGPKILPVRSLRRSAEEAERLLASSREEAEQKKSAAADEAGHDQERAAASAAYSQPVRAELPEPTYTDPEAWLKDIRELRKANKQGDADREWRRFRAAFPNYEVAETDIAREAKK